MNRIGSLHIARAAPVNYIYMNIYSLYNYFLRLNCEVVYTRCATVCILHKIDLGLDSVIFKLLQPRIKESVGSLENGLNLNVYYNRDHHARAVRPTA